MSRAPELSEHDRIIVTRGQSRFPLVRRPFAVLAEEADLDERAVIGRLEALKSQGFIRKIGPVFESARLGLASELIAAEVEPGQVDEVGAAVAQWGPVTHCYAREHDVNLWFAAVAPGLAWLAWAREQTAELAGVKDVWRLPALRRFKIGVHFDLLGEPVHSRADAAAAAPPVDARGTGRGRAAAMPDVWLVGALDTDLPLVPDAFDELGAGIGLGGNQVVSVLRDWMSEGYIRRYGLLVSHRPLGFTANAMTAWSVPKDAVEQAARALVASEHVSHCYERPPFSEFPFNLYAMIHGSSREACLEVVADLSRAVGMGEAAVLFSTREFKKSAPNYSELLTARSEYGEG